MKVIFVIWFVLWVAHALDVEKKLKILVDRESNAVHFSWRKWDEI